MVMPRNRVSIRCAGCGVEFEVPRSRAAQQHCTRWCRDDIMRRVDQSGGGDACWPWLGADDGRGLYGRARSKCRKLGAHVAVYERLVGPVPGGLELDHLCRNPTCVNPAHLEPVTRTVNVERQPKVIAARSAERCPNGHLWTADNTYRHPSGARVCRACTRAAQARYQQRKA